MGRFEELFPGKDWNDTEVETALKRESIAVLYDTLIGGETTRSQVSVAESVLKTMITTKQIENNFYFVTQQDIEKAKLKAGIVREKSVKLLKAVSK